MPVFSGGVVIFRLAYPAVILRLAPRHSERSEESFFRSFAVAQDDIIVNVTQHDINVNVARDDNQVLSAHVTVV